MIRILEEDSEFLTDDLKFFKKNIEEHKELGGEIVLKLGTINKMQEKGILQKFYRICKANNFFPKWVENVDNDVDII